MEPRDDNPEFFELAYEGAQIRALATEIAGGKWKKFAEFQLRSLIVLCFGDVAEAAAHSVLDRLAPLEFPVVISRRLPHYTGALDVVLVLGEQDPMERLHVVQSAHDRGALTALIDSGMQGVAEEAPSATLRLGTPLGSGVVESPLRYAGAIYSSYQLLRGDYSDLGAELYRVADAVDQELANLAPSVSYSENAARQLRNLATEYAIIHSGQLSIARMVSALWAACGLHCCALSRPELWKRLRTQPQPDIFHDPYVDPEATVLPSKVVMWGAYPTEAEAELGSTRVENATQVNTGSLEELLILVVRGFSATTYSVSPEDC
ncbi:hypothetical protein GP475_03180 [Corynebacterium poyangense]|uniref:Uncharacterized protein n=1 Tax=Corynebacterium poyangense TaxID=2684405 RepID=A0A7H0SMI6_9CORY|nr:hypothetical protein [Corynebacterium poyangense]MBZ8176866.1 hypothetical protein [Corynebacterium poyangense]QNQ89761.1 hypothetical protein GP475_03180 [Corynebacterium poyangense]